MRACILNLEFPEIQNLILFHPNLIHSIMHPDIDRVGALGFALQCMDLNGGARGRSWSGGRDSAHPTESMAVRASGVAGQDVAEARFGLQEGVDHGGIEMHPASLRDDLGGLFVGHGFLVDPLCHEGVVHVGKGHEPAAEGDLLAGKAVGIARAVPFFVVGHGNVPGQHGGVAS